MSWIYRIAEHTLYRSSEVGNLLVSTNCYAGHPPFENDPTACHIPDLGPLPPGLYTIGPEEDSFQLGPIAMPLTPAATNTMFARSGFWIHGDSIEKPGYGSDGCIVVDHETRVSISASGDKDLLVQA